MADDFISYSDFIKPDGSIDDLLAKLSELSNTFANTVKSVKTEASALKEEVKGLSSATTSGRAAIEAISVASDKYNTVNRNVNASVNLLEKQIKNLQDKLINAKGATADNQRELDKIGKAYEKLTAELASFNNLYGMLTAAEKKNSAVLDNVILDTNRYRSELASLSASLSTIISGINKLRDAKSKLSNVNNEENRTLIETQEQLRKENNSYKEQLRELEKVAQAKERLKAAQDKLKAAETANYATNDDAKLKSLQLREKETQRLADLQIKLNHSAVGSYNALAAQYEINKIKLNAMSAEMRNAVDIGGKLEQETLAIYKQMIHLQEATGNYKLSVGNYKTAFNGLRNATQQVVRELPAAAVSLNTFFLAISNNIPILIDEIQRVKEKNAMLRAEGRPTESAIKTIVKALLNWQTALVILLAVLSKAGKQIIDWFKEIYRGSGYVKSSTELLREVTKELEKTNDNYGRNLANYALLRKEWNASNKDLNDLKSLTVKYKDELNNLNIELKSVASAESFFNEMTDPVIKAFQLRAKAAAYLAEATKRYNKALVQEEESKQEPGFFEKLGGRLTSGFSAFAAARGGGASLFNAIGMAYQVGILTNASGILNEELIKASKAAKSEALETEGEKLIEEYTNLLAEAQKILEPWIKRNKDRNSHRQPRDLTDIINKNQITAQRQYEESITKLIDDEYAKRRKAAADEVQDENNKLREMLRKNEDYVLNIDGKYKALTDEQKKQIEQQNKWINATIVNNLKILAKQLEQIEKEQQIASLKIKREALIGINSSVAEGKTIVTPNIPLTRNAEDIEASLVEERKLMEQNLDIEYQLIIESNKKLLEAGDEYARSEEEILLELNKKRVELWAQYDKIILDNRARDIANQLELVQKGTDEELQLLLKQNEIARQLALAENAKKPAAQQQSTADINKSFTKKATVIKGGFELISFEQAQKTAEATFNIVKHSTEVQNKFQLEQERDLWNKKIQLAESGALDWSKEQIKAAKATVKGIEREIKDVNDFINITGDRGVGGALLVKLGFNDEQIEAISEYTNIILDNIQTILDAEVEAAEKAVEVAEKRTEAAKSAYEAEVEARNNGYANNVATTKKELQLAKKNQQEKEKLLADAQRRQEAINSLVQASSLVTASANIWSSLSSIPIVGPALAIAMIATMWGSFAAAKIRAKQVTAQSEEYGEGGLEFLEGGSHASGNDIDLQTKNSKGKNMRAEGGEAMAIINKRSTRKYRKALPSIIDSLNKGVFEDKYLNSLTNDGFNIAYNNNIDLSKLENDVQGIRKQNELKQYVLPDGSIIIQHKNVKRIIHK